MIVVDKLTKSYGSVQAIRDVSFRVDKGEVVGFLGPNGAGKTTTLRIVAGFLGATRGRVMVDGFDIVEHPIEARARMGYMPENIPLYPEMRVREYLRFRAEVKRVPRAKRTEAVRSAMRDVRVDDHADVIIGKLSKGYRQRVGLADALVSSPPVLVLDEPTSGLDPNQIREVRELIRLLAVDRTVLLSTHILFEVEATCDRALVIDGGKLVAQGSLEDLRRIRQTLTTRFVVRGNRDTAINVLRQNMGAEGVEPATTGSGSGAGELSAWDVTWKRDGVDPGTAVEQTVNALVAAGVAVREARSHTASLEEVFALLTEDEDLESRRTRTGAGSGPKGVDS